MFTLTVCNDPSWIKMWLYASHCLLLSDLTYPTT